MQRQIDSHWLHVFILYMFLYYEYHYPSGDVKLLAALGSAAYNILNKKIYLKPSIAIMATIID